MGVVYYKYKSEKEVYSMPLAHAFISASELKHLILTSDRHGRGRTRGHGPREGIAISNSQTGEEYTDENAMVPQNTTVLIRRIAGQLSENIVLVSSRKVTEGCSVPLSKSVVTDSSSKSLSSTEVQDEDAAITAVIDAAEFKLEDHQSKKGQGGGRFPSGSRYGHGPFEGEIPPPGYVCRSCGVAGHFIQNCTQEIKKPPPGYICYRCRIPGHFIQHCPTINDPNFDKNKMARWLAPVVTPSPVDGILESLASAAASASAVDDLPAELHCQLCKKVTTDAVLTSKCCFDSFCDKCIRDYMITQSKCICGAKVLADSLIPNHTLRGTISNMLSTRAGSTSGTNKHRSSSGSNPDPKLQNHTLSVVSERLEMKQRMDHVSEAATPDAGLQVTRKDDLVNEPLEKLAPIDDPLSKGEFSSAELSVEKAAASDENLKLQDGSESTVKVTTVSGTLEQNAIKEDQPKRRKKAGSTKIVQPNNADFGYNIPIDPAYYNPFVCGYPWVTEPYMYGSMGMPYGGYPMGPYGVNPLNSMPPQALPMNGYPQNYHWHEAQPTLKRGTETAGRSRLSERPQDTCVQSRSSECNRQQGFSKGSELRNRTRSGPEKRNHRRSDMASDDYYKDHSRKRMHVSSLMDNDKQSSRRLRDSPRSMTREDSSDDERNFKRWGRRSSVTVDSRH